MLKKFSFVLLGLFLVFISVEISYRVWAFYYKDSFNKDFILESKNQIYNKTYTIFTIGESTTAVSADESKNFLVQSTSYPTYLLNELSSKYPHVKFKIHNLGIMGGASDSVIYRLLEELSKTKPDLIISMVGMKDYQYTPSVFQEMEKGPVSFLSFLISYSKSLQWISNVLFELNNKSRWVKKMKPLERLINFHFLQGLLF